MSGPVERWKLVAVGTVQLVGYRQRVKREADARGLFGWVLNDEVNEDQVLINVQGPADKLEEFREAIAKPEDRSVPTAVTREGEGLPADEKLRDFRVKRGEVHLETLERMEEGNRVLGSMDRRLGSMDGRLGSMDRRLGSMDRRLGSMDRRLGSMDGRLGSMDGRLGSLESLGRETLAETRKVGVAITKVGASVEKGNQATLLLHRDTIHRFDEMSVAYGMIGKRLGLIEKDLRAQTKATVQQTAALLRLAKSMEKVARSSSGTRPSRRK